MRKNKAVSVVKQVVARKVEACKITSKTRPKTTSSDCVTYQDCLEQAEICREQARSAARLKRFKAAYGLFTTAIALYGQAILLGGEACADAKERLRQLKDEMSAYGELAKSMERPLVMNVPTPGATSNNTMTDSVLTSGAMTAGTMTGSMADAISPLLDKASLLKP